MNEDEFEAALEYMSQKTTNMTLESIGISKGLLGLALAYIALILVLLFFFIFLGIKGFAVGGSFGAVINSLMPIGKYILILINIF